MYIFLPNLLKKIFLSENLISFDLIKFSLLIFKINYVFNLLAEGSEEMEALPPSVQPLAVMAGNEVIPAISTLSNNSIIATSTSNWVVPTSSGSGSSSSSNSNNGNIISTLSLPTSNTIGLNQGNISHSEHDTGHVIQALPSTSSGPIVIANPHSPRLHFNKSKRGSNMMRHMVSKYYFVVTFHKQMYDIIRPRLLLLV